MKTITEKNGRVEVVEELAALDVHGMPQRVSWSFGTPEDAEKQSVEFAAALDAAPEVAEKLRAAKTERDAAAAAMAAEVKG